MRCEYLVLRGLFKGRLRCNYRSEAGSKYCRKHNMLLRFFLRTYEGQPEKQENRMATRTKHSVPPKAIE